MSDVEVGGATVFPIVGARVAPEKVSVHYLLSFLSFIVSFSFFLQVKALESLLYVRIDYIYLLERNKPDQFTDFD